MMLYLIITNNGQSSIHVQQFGNTLFDQKMMVMKSALPCSRNY